jgi:CheY-like chemotaxis protein
MHQLLIVDDSKLHRGFLKLALRPLDCAFAEASNGREALRAIEAERPDCMILDLLMPEMNGFALLRELRSRNVVLPIVVATTDMLEETRRACIDLGALDVIYKPLHEGEVRHAVERALSLANSVAPTTRVAHDQHR